MKTTPKHVSKPAPPTPKRPPLSEDSEVGKFLKDANNELKESKLVIFLTVYFV